MMFPQVLASIQVRIIGAELNLALGLFGSMIGAGASPGQVIGRTLINADIAGPVGLDYSTWRGWWSLPG